MVRAGAFASFLAVVATTSFDALGRLPVNIMHPPGAMEYLSWRFYERLLTPHGMIALKALLILSLAAGAAGYCTTISTRIATGLLILYQGILRSFGHFNHDEMAPLYCLLILAFSPCGDGFAVDRLGQPSIQQRSSAYGYPILLMRLVMAWVYCSAGLLKLRLGGLEYFSRDNLAVTAIYHSLDNLHDTSFRAAFLLPTVREWMPLASAGAVAWEILFPIAVFSRRIRPWYLVTGVFFHLGTTMLLNIFFPLHLSMYLVFVDWPAVVARLRRFRWAARFLDTWNHAVSIPETFPGLRMAPPRAGGTLLWDGTCGFCATLVQRLQRLGRHRFGAEPFQELQERLPATVLRWSHRQMHWVSEDGTILGGSRALTRAFAASGFTATAAFLDTQLLRPWVWLCYRLIASNRGFFARILPLLPKVETGR